MNTHRTKDISMRNLKLLPKYDQGLKFHAEFEAPIWELDKSILYVWKILRRKIFTIYGLPA